MHHPADEALAVRRAAAPRGEPAGPGLPAWALAWLAEVSEAPGSRAAAQAVVRGLARGLGFEAAWLGWAAPQGCCLAAAWRPAPAETLLQGAVVGAVVGAGGADARGGVGAEIDADAGPGPACEAAMDEAVDQGLSTAWPPLPAADGGLGPITLALQALVPAGVPLQAFCVPLAHPRQPGKAIAAVCLLRREPSAGALWPLPGALPASEGQASPAAEAGAAAAGRAQIDQAEPPEPLQQQEQQEQQEQLAQLEHLLALAAPLLWLHRQGERTLLEHIRSRLRQAWGGGAQAQAAERRRARQRRWALAAVLGLAALWPVPATVGGRARVEGAEQRVLSAPADGYLSAARALPGDRVQAGQVLADLAEQDLQLERDKWASQIAQHESSYAAAMARAGREGSDGRAEAAVALARLQEAQAEMDRVGEQLQRTRLLAPFDGVLIEGDLSQRIGAPVRQGDPLLTVASTARFRVIVEVDETEIARVQPGQRGELSLSALPWHTLPLRVQRITPLARAVEGGNVFEVQAELDLAGADAAGQAALLAQVRPGLPGQARVEVGRAPWLWDVLAPWLRRARVAWWAWVA